MFETYCAECSGHRLVFPSQVTRMDNRADGVVVHYVCTCGASGSWQPRAAA